MKKENKQVLLTTLLILSLAVILYALYVMNYQPSGFAYKDF